MLTSQPIKLIAHSKFASKNIFRLTAYGQGVFKMVTLTPIDMHVVRAVDFKGQITKIRDYRKPANPLDEDAKTANFVGIKLSTGNVIHIPTDRGEKMEKLANEVIRLWNDAGLDLVKTTNAIKALFFESDIAIMVTVVKRGPDAGKNQYRFYDALAADTFEPSQTTQQPRVKIVHEKGDATNGYFSV